MISSFKLLLYIMKLNLKRINSFVVSILVTSCENRQLFFNYLDKAWLCVNYILCLIDVAFFFIVGAVYNLMRSFLMLYFSSLIAFSTLIKHYFFS